MDLVNILEREISFKSILEKLWKPRIFLVCLCVCTCCMHLFRFTNTFCCTIDGTSCKLCNLWKQGWNPGVPSFLCAFGGRKSMRFELKNLSVILDYPV